MRAKVASGITGVVLGFTLSRIGFSSWDEIHAMFTLSDLRLMLGFAIGVTALAVSWIAIGRTIGARWPPRKIHRGTVPGALLFGAGWAICGACPGVVLVQIGEGQIGALATLAGMFAGNWLYAAIHERWLRWPQANCADI